MILHNDVLADEIFIEPPEPCVLITDEDSGDEKIAVKWTTYQVNAQSTNKWMEKIKTGKKTYTWIKGGDFDELQLNFPALDFSKYIDMSI